jgi:hypothetical protein
MSCHQQIPVAPAPTYSVVDRGRQICEANADVVMLPAFEEGAVDTSDEALDAACVQQCTDAGSQCAFVIASKATVYDGVSIPALCSRMPACALVDDPFDGVIEMTLFEKN